MRVWLQIQGSQVESRPGPIPYTAVYNPQEYTIRTPTFDHKILEKKDFVSFDRTLNSAF